MITSLFDKFPYAVYLIGRMITLPIKRKWFDMIASGEKTEEYRSLTPRYLQMFLRAALTDSEFVCMLRNGYSNKSPSITVRVHMSVGYGKPEWGADPDSECIILSIIDILDINK